MNNRAKVVCPISASGYFHAGSLRRLLAARRRADELGAQLIVRFDDCYSTIVEPGELLRNIIRGINVSFSLSYFRKAIRLCGIQCDDIIRMFELLPDVKAFMGTELRKIASLIIQAGEYRRKLVEDGIDESIVSKMWLLPEEDAAPIAYQLKLEDTTVLIEELYGYPGETIAGLLADHMMEVTRRFPDAEGIETIEQLEALIARCYPNVEYIENHIIQPIRLDSRPVKENEYWVCKDPEPELAVCRLIQLYGRSALITALQNSIDEGENDWEVITDRWLKRSRLAPRGGPHHLRYFDSEGPQVHTTIHNVPQCSSSSDPTPIVRFAPSASGYLHVGNFRTYIACRDLADSIGGKLFVRIDDDHHECLDIQHITLSAGLVRAQLATSMQYIIKSLQASGVEYDGLYLLSDTAPAVLSMVGHSLTMLPNDIRNIDDIFSKYTNSKSFQHLLEELGLYTWNPCAGYFRMAGPVGVPYNSISIYRFDGMPSSAVNSTVSDTAVGITHAVRGADLMSLATSEDYLRAHMPWLQSITNYFVPLLTFENQVISKSRYHLDFEPETSVLKAISRYGAEPLVNALRNSLRDSVNDWEEVKRRWLE